MKTFRLFAATILACSFQTASAYDVTRGALQNHPALVSYGYNINAIHNNNRNVVYYGNNTSTYNGGNILTLKNLYYLNEIDRQIERRRRPVNYNNPRICMKVPVVENRGSQLCMHLFLDRALPAPRAELYFSNDDIGYQGPVLTYENGILIESTVYHDNFELQEGGKRYERINEKTYAVTQYGRERTPVAGSYAEISAEQAAQEIGVKSVYLQDALSPSLYERVVKATKKIRGSK